MNPNRRAVLRLAVLPALGLTGCETLERVAQLASPDVSVSGAAVRSFDLEAAVIDLNWRVRNPASVPLPLGDLSYAVESGSERVAEGTASLEGTVPGNGSRELTTPLRVAYAPLLRTLAGVRPGSVLPYRVTGSVAAGDGNAFSLPLSARGELPVPAVPAVAIERVRWAELSISQAVAELSVRLDNPNEFPLSEVGFGGLALSLAGRRVAAIDTDARLSAPAGGAARVSLPVRFSPVQLGTGVLGALRGERLVYDLAGDLSASTPYGLFSVPVSASGTTVTR